MSPEHAHTRQSWRAMLRRCYDRNHRSYPDYGGRGVRVFFGWMPQRNRWQRRLPGFAGFESFLEDVGVRPEGYHLARIDPDGHYDPWNVRWEPAADNIAERNTRVAGRHDLVVEVDGVALSQAAWAHRLGINYRTLSRRLQRGWGLDAYRVPAGGRKPR